MVLNELGKKLNSAISSLSASSAIDEAVRTSSTSCSKAGAGASTDYDLTQAFEAALKTICAALLESDVNVKLVKSLRERVRVKVLPQLEEIQKKSSADTLAGNKGKQLIHKVCFLLGTECARAI